MSIGKPHRTILVIALLSSLALSPSASSRPWKPTPIQIAADYASINHDRGHGDIVTIAWWAPPTVTNGTPLAALLGKYVLISVTHSHVDVNQQATGITFNEIDGLEAKDKDGTPLSGVPENALPAASVGLLATFEATVRQALGPRGKGAKFFLFDAGAAIRPCEEGGISIPYDGEIYTWDTPFPGCRPGLLYGRLGVRIGQITKDMAANLHLQSTRGVIVTAVDDTGAAKPAGIQAGDLITRMGGKEIVEPRDLPRIVAETPANKTVEVVIIRAGEEKSIHVMLGPEITPRAP